jgi:hypothetical protein
MKGDWYSLLTLFTAMTDVDRRGKIAKYNNENYLIY